jgi:uncharacterized protein (UPF0276 family)
LKLAVNYSPAAAGLITRGSIAFDAFKCPAWPELIATARTLHPLYVHLPLTAGRGLGDAVNSETGRVTDWPAMEALLAETGTPFVNVHLQPRARDYPGIPVDSASPAHLEQIQANLIRDVQAVVQRCGPERVIVENIYGGNGAFLRVAYLPEVVRRVVAETGCGFLLDLSHARLAARALGMDERAYVESLPLERVREMHLTGIQTFDERWAAVLREAGLDEATVQRYEGRTMDHLPLIEADWEITAWALGQVQRGAWGRPWAVTLEYGGVGPLWEALTDEQVLSEQVPRLRNLIDAAP